MKRRANQQMASAGTCRTERRTGSPRGTARVRVLQKLALQQLGCCLTGRLHAPLLLKPEGGWAVAALLLSSFLVCL